MEAWKGFVGGRQENNFFRRHQVIGSQIDRRRARPRMGPWEFCLVRFEMSHLPGVAVAVDVNGATALNCRNEVRYMLIRIGYDIAIGLSNPTPIVFLLRVHSSRESTLVAAEVK